MKKATIERHEKITEIAATIFIVSCVSFIPVDLLYDEIGISWLTAIVLYPSMIVLFGNIGIMDIYTLINFLKKKKYNCEIQYHFLCLLQVEVAAFWP